MEALFLSEGVSSTHFPADVNISRSGFSHVNSVNVLGFHHPSKQAVGNASNNVLQITVAEAYVPFCG